MLGRNSIINSLFTGVTLVTLSGCGGGVITTRTVDEPVGKTTAYGAPKNTTYTAQLDAMRDQARLTIYRSAQCDVLPVTLMQHYEEKVKNEKVIERVPISKRQVAGAPDGTTQCNQSYARNVDVMLEVADGGRFPLGPTDEHGQVTANLAKLFQVGSYADLPPAAKVVLRPIQAQPTVEAGTIQLSQLASQQQQVSSLLAELEAILAKGERGASLEEISRSYVVYSQLAEVAGDDPRVVGLRTRFWELFYGRKLEEARERMGRNLQALGEAKETLKVMGAAAIPIYIQAAVNTGTMDSRSLEWASLRLIQALRGTPSICTAGFAWANVPSYGWPADAQLAAQYVQFGYGNGHAATIQAACRTF